MKIIRNQTFGLVIDLQEKLMPHMHDEAVLEVNCIKLIEGLGVLKIPIVLSQQYTKGLGETVPRIKSVINDFSPFEKLSFSCCGDDSITTEMDKLKLNTVIVCGIESHVCVLQTVLDLLEKSFKVVVVADCVASRKESDKAIAIDRMRQAGAIISSYESVLFELTQRAGSDEFKLISKLVK